MTALRIVLSLLAVVFVLATVLPLARSARWWVRMFDFPRMQIAAGAIATLGLYGVVAVWQGEPGTWGWVLFAALGASTVYQVLRMWPYTRLHRPQTLAADGALADPDRRLRLMVSNVLMTNREGERWLGVVRQADPDVVVAVETDDWWAETAGVLKETHPHAVELPQDDTYGMCVYSRLPLDSVEVRHLVEPEVPSLNLTARLRSGEPVTLIFLHPRPPRPDIQQDSALRDAELVMAGREVAHVDRAGRGRRRPQRRGLEPLHERCSKSSRACSTPASGAARSRRSTPTTGGSATRSTTCSTRTTSRSSSSGACPTSAATTSRC